MRNILWAVGEGATIHTLHSDCLERALVESAVFRIGR
jgi:hypothetical protein